MFLFCSSQSLAKGTPAMPNKAFIKELLSLFIVFFAAYAFMVVA